MNLPDKYRMRDLLNLLDNVLYESVGLANRKPGEKFKNKVNDEITFQGLDFYPESGRYDTPEELQSALDDWLTQMSLTPDRINWINSPTKAVGAFAIATFTGEDDTPYYLGKWMGNISPNRVLNTFSHDSIPGGFTYQSKAGKKENTGYKPSEILKQFQNNTPESIAQQVAEHFGTGSDEANAINIFINSDLPCQIPKGNMNPDAFRDYFCEMLQPIALVMGKNVEGNASEAADIFFGSGAGYGDATISFNSNTIGGLYDSLLVNGKGKQIKLSSKGKDGASASVQNLLNSVNELSATAAGKKLLTTHAEVIDILNTIKTEGHFGAPLALAQQYDLINAKEAQQVSNLKGMGPNDKIIGTGILSKKLEEFYNKRQSKNLSRVIPLEHLTASIAYRVAEHINKTTNFGAAASDILNNAALVQMYTDTKVSGDMITITKLTAVYPSQTITGVLLDASKVYYSTGGNGNYTFTILKNGAKPSDVNPIDSVDSGSGESAELSTSDLDQFTNTPRLSGPGAQAARTLTAPKTTVDVLGREKRRQ